VFDFWRIAITNPKNRLDNRHGFAITLCGYNVFDISLGKGIYIHFNLFTHQVKIY
jgi:hypothetical protein